MNRIVREHYPAALLPEDLRAGLDLDAHVTVSVEVEKTPDSEPEMTLEEIFALAAKSPRRTADEIDAAIAAQRDEWQLRE